MNGMKRFRNLNDDLLAEWRELGHIVAGVDEVGRGSLAGPVVAAAVILPAGIKIPGARDSKQLSDDQRQRLAVQIRRAAVSVGIGWAGADEVDSHGLSRAVRQSGLRALAQLGEFDCVMLDGSHNYLDGIHLARAVVKADQTCLSVACASIIAKVARDNYMRRLHNLYPEFGFDRHVGYGTPQHLRAIEAGLSPLHRRSFSPVMARVH